MSLLRELRRQLQSATNVAKQGPMSSYMKNKFSFLGISSPERKLLLKSAIALHSPPAFPSADLDALFVELYNLPEREFHYAAIDLYAQQISGALKKKSALSDADHNRFLQTLENAALTKHLHWDSIDTISPSMIGVYFQMIPKERVDDISDRWYTLGGRGDIWIDRALILHQLRYKHDTNTTMLERMIKRALGAERPSASRHADLPTLLKAQEWRKQEAADCFWIAKSIGWALRQYAYVNPQYVRTFVANHSELLPTLSKKEALRRIGGGGARGSSTVSTTSTKNKKRTKKQVDDDDEDDDGGDDDDNNVDDNDDEVPAAPQRRSKRSKNSY